MNEPKKAQLLIVDDEEHIRESLKMLLESDDREISIASNGAEGISILKSKTIDCVLSDITMPIMDGISFIKNVRQFNKKVPFIFFTAYGSEDFMLEALKHGATDFINKPEFENLQRIVDRGIASNFQKEAEDLDDQFLSEYKKMIADHD